MRVNEKPASREDAPRDHVSFIGGARVGLWNVTWPFARLRVSRDTLDLWVLGPGSLRFPREAIVSVSEHVSLPIIGWGLRIEPKHSAYPETLIFWSFKKPSSLMLAMEETGFLTKVPAGDK
jgi:hypothetical protein